MEILATPISSFLPQRLKDQHLDAATGDDVSVLACYLGSSSPILPSVLTFIHLISPILSSVLIMYKVPNTCH